MNILDKLVAPNEIVDKANLKNLFFQSTGGSNFLYPGSRFFFILQNFNSSLSLC